MAREKAPQAAARRPRARQPAAGGEAVAAAATGARADPTGPGDLPGARAGEPQPAMDLVGLAADALALVFQHLPTFQHCAKLATLCRAFAAAARAARPAFLPRVQPDGEVLEPKSGRFFMQARLLSLCRRGRTRRAERRPSFCLTPLSPSQTPALA